MCNIKFICTVLTLQIASFYHWKCSYGNVQENFQLFLDDSELDRYKLFVNIINEIKTMGDVQVIFTESDLNKILSIEHYDEKDKAVVKFQTKINCLLCTYSLIVKYMLYHLKSLSKSKISDDETFSENLVSNDISKQYDGMKFTQLKNNNKVKRVTFADKTKIIDLEKLNAYAINGGEKPKEYSQGLKIKNNFYRKKKHLIKYQSTIELFTKSVQKMLSVLYAGKIIAPDWLWIVSIKLNGIKVEQMTVDEFYDENLEISVRNHLEEHCTNLNMLEPIKIKDERYTSDNSGKYTRNLLMELLYESSDSLVRIYRYHVQFDIYKFYWTEYCDNFPKNIVPSSELYPQYVDDNMYIPALSTCINTISRTWKTDYFAILKYFDFLKNSLLYITAYCILKHSLYYIKNRYKKKTGFLKFLGYKKPLFNWFLESPRGVLSDISQFLKMEKSIFFLDINEHLISKNNKTKKKLEQFANGKLYSYFIKYSKALGLNVASIIDFKENVKSINILKQEKLELNLWSVLLYKYFNIIRLFMSPVNFSIYEYFKKSDPINYTSDFS